MLCNIPWHSMQVQARERSCCCQAPTAGPTCRLPCPWAPLQINCGEGTILKAWHPDAEAVYNNRWGSQGGALHARGGS